jgi:hypothetical protein
MAERTCFYCLHSQVCFIKKSVTEETAHIKFNIDGDAAPGKWVDIFKAIAESCLEFRNKLNQK